VLDTNVIASGFIDSTGPPGKTLAAWRDRRLDIVVSPSLLHEVADILRHPRLTRAYGLTGGSVADLLRLLESQAIRVPGRITIPPTARDPRDDHILACAVEGHADYLITGDNDLLDLGRFRDIPIVSPAAFAAVPSDRLPRPAVRGHPGTADRRRARDRRHTRTATLMHLPRAASGESAPPRAWPSGRFIMWIAIPARN
jgi:hypothetical protein